MATELSTSKHYLIVSGQEKSLCVGTQLSFTGSPERTMRLYDVAKEDEKARSSGDPGYSDHLRWSLQAAAYGKYRLINKHSGLTLGLSDKDNIAIQRRILTSDSQSTKFIATITEKGTYDHPFLADSEKVPYYQIAFEKGTLLLTAEGNNLEDRVLGKSASSSSNKQFWYLIEDGLQDPEMTISVEDPDFSTTENISALDYAFMVVGPTLEATGIAGTALSGGLSIMISCIQGTGNSNDLYEKLYDAIVDAMSALLDEQTITYWKQKAQTEIKAAGKRTEGYKTKLDELGPSIAAFSCLYGGEYEGSLVDDGAYQHLENAIISLESSGESSDSELAIEYSYSGLSFYINAASEFLSCIEELLALWDEFNTNETLEIDRDLLKNLPSQAFLRERYSASVDQFVRHLNRYYFGSGLGSKNSILGFRRTRQDDIFMQLVWLTPDVFDCTFDKKSKLHQKVDPDNKHEEHRLYLNEMRNHVAVTLDRNMGNVPEVVKQWELNRVEIFKETETPKSYASSLRWDPGTEKIVLGNGGSLLSKQDLDHLLDGDPTEEFANQEMAWQTSYTGEIIVGIASKLNNDKHVVDIMVAVMNLETGMVRYSSCKGNVNAHNYEKWVELGPGQAMTGIALREKDDNLKNMKIYYQNIDRSNAANHFLDSELLDTRYPNGGDELSEYEIEYRPGTKSISTSSTSGTTTKAIIKNPDDNYVVTGIYFQSSNKKGGFTGLALKVARLIAVESTTTLQASAELVEENV